MQLVIMLLVPVVLIPFWVDKVKRIEREIKVLSRNYFFCLNYMYIKFKLDFKFTYLYVCTFLCVALGYLMYHTHFYPRVNLTYLRFTLIDIKIKRFI